MELGFSVGELLAAIFLGAVVAVAAVELGKTFLGFRSRFHEGTTKEFIERGNRLWNDLRAPRSKYAADPYAWEQLSEILGLHDLGSHEEKWAYRYFRLRFPLVYDLPLEQYGAQLASATDYAVRAPERYPELVLGFGGRGLYDAWLRQASRRKFTDPEFDDASPPKIGDPESDRDPDLLREVDHFVGQGLDNLQVLIGSKWKRRVRAVAALFAALATVGILWLLDSPTNDWPVGAVVGAVVAGPASWFLRDVASWVEGSRR